MMDYKGYSAKVEFDDQNDVFYGEVVGLRDALMFQGKSVKELRQGFKLVVDSYLEDCKQHGEDPEKPYSGNFLVRTNAELHRRIAFRSQLEGKSLNAWVEDKLTEAIEASEDRARQSAATTRQTAERGATPPSRPALEKQTPSARTKQTKPRHAESLA